MALKHLAEEGAPLENNINNPVPKQGFGATPLPEPIPFQPGDFPVNPPFHPFPIPPFHPPVPPGPVLPPAKQLSDLSISAQNLINSNTACVSGLTGNSGCDQCSQPLCPPDANVTCQVNTVGQGMKPCSINNAYKGDIILCPGDGTGPIGVLLNSLNPQQIYTHTGIMVSDHYDVRHATQSKDWLKKEHSNGSLFGVVNTGVPSNGFDNDAIKYGWPGTLTQSVDEAYYADTRDNYGPAKYCNLPNVDEADKAYLIKALTFDPIIDDNKIKQHPMVVSACPSAIHQSPEIRGILHMVADEALNIRGHYRFYAYTDAAASLDPTFNGPAMGLYRPNQSVDLEGNVTDPANPCNSIPKSGSIAVVCSSLIWTAVQRVTAKMKTLITLDDTAGVPFTGCDNTITAPNGAYTADPAKLTPDGLYFYTELERQQAATALFAQVHNDVIDNITDNINDLYDALDSFHSGPPVIRHGVNQLVTTAASGVVGLSTFLNISTSLAAELVEILVDMPNKIARQLCNTFASDNPDTTSDAWQNPGVGRAVSPDNIIWSWASLQSINLHQPGERFVPNSIDGLYGHNEPVSFSPGQYGDIPNSTWQLSPGPALMQGFVFLKLADGTIVPLNKPAIITMACQQSASNERGFYSMKVPASNDTSMGYWATAAWHDPTANITWQVAEAVRVPYQAGPTPHNFTLVSPAVDCRMVSVKCVIQVKDQQLIKDITGGSSATKTARLGPYNNPNDPTDNTGKFQDFSFNASAGPDISCNVSVNVSGLTDGDVLITISAQLMNDSDIQDRFDNVIHTVTAGSGGFQVPMMHLDSGGTLPNDALINIFVFNDQQN